MMWWTSSTRSKPSPRTSLATVTANGLAYAAASSASPSLSMPSSSRPMFCAITSVNRSRTAPSLNGAAKGAR